MNKIQQLLNDHAVVSEMMNDLFGYYDESNPLSDDQKKGLAYILWRFGTSNSDKYSIRKWANRVRHPNIMRIILKGYSEEITDGEGDDLWDKGFSTRAYNILKRNGYDSLEKLRNLTMEKLCSFRECGKNTIKEITQILAENGIIVKGEYIAIRKYGKLRGMPYNHKKGEQK